MELSKRASALAIAISLFACSTARDDSAPPAAALTEAPAASARAAPAENDEGLEATFQRAQRLATAGRKVEAAIERQRWCKRYDTERASIADPDLRLQWDALDARWCQWLD